MAAARDIYNRRSDSFGGSFTADLAKLQFAGNNGQLSQTGMLVQQMQAAYQQQFQRIYELGSNAVYYVAGRASGTLSINRIAGPRRLGKAFYQKYGDVCQARTNTMSFSLVEGCNTEESRESYTCNFVVLTSISIGVTAQDTLVNNGLQAGFSAFEYDE